MTHTGLVGEVADCRVKLIALVGHRSVIWLPLRRNARRVSLYSKGMIWFSKVVRDWDPIYFFRRPFCRSMMKVVGMEPV